MDEQWYADAFDLMRRAQEQGVAAFCMHTLESGDVRLVGLPLPVKLVANMMRTAASQYEKQAAPDTLN